MFKAKWACGPWTAAAALLGGLQLPMSVQATGFAASVSAASGSSNLTGPKDAKSQRGVRAISLLASSNQMEISGETATGVGQATAHAVARGGGLHIRALASAETGIVARGQMAASGQSSASASVDDSFVVLATACANTSACGAGSAGLLSFYAGATGSASGSAVADLTGQRVTAGWSGSSAWQSDIRIDAGYYAGATSPTSTRWTGSRSLSQTAGHDAVQTGTGDTGMALRTIGFRFGSPISVHLGGSVTAYAYALVQGSDGSSASAGAVFEGDMGHTVAWGGIAEIRDAAGNPLSNYSAVSNATGFDYSQAYVGAIPEPATWALALCGLALLACAKSRRRLGREPVVTTG